MSDDEAPTVRGERARKRNQIVTVTAQRKDPRSLGITVFLFFIISEIIEQLGSS